MRLQQAIRKDGRHIFKDTAMNVTRRQFFKVTAAGAGATTLAAVGLMPTNAFAEVRQYKLTGASQARNNCTYCSVGCGTILYSMGDGAKNAKKKIFHIEGDPDHPVSRGSLCPKGASLVDFVNSPNRVLYPEVREPFTNEWKRISWKEALQRIARHIKDERDASFQRNRYPDRELRPLARADCAGYAGARVPRADCVRTGFHFRTRRNDQHLCRYSKHRFHHGDGRQCRRSAPRGFQMGD